MPPACELNSYNAIGTLGAFYLLSHKKHEREKNPETVGLDDDEVLLLEAVILVVTKTAARNKKCLKILSLNKHSKVLVHMPRKHRNGDITQMALFSVAVNTWLSSALLKKAFLKDFSLLNPTDVGGEVQSNESMEQMLQCQCEL